MRGAPKPPGGGCDVQEILRRVHQHWSKGWDGNFSPDWDQDNAESGFWLATEDAEAIITALAQLQLALHPAKEV